MYDQSQRSQLWEHPTSLVYEKKFDTALRKTIVRMTQEQLESNMKEDELPFHVKLLLKNSSKQEILDSITDNSCMGKIILKIITDTDNGECYGERKSDQITKLYTLAKKNLEFQHQYSNKNNHLPSKFRSNTILSKKLKNLQPTPLIHNFMYVCHRMKMSVDQLGFVRRKISKDKTDDEKINELSKDAVWNISELGMEMIWSMNLCIIRLYDGSVYCLPTSYIIMIHNKLSDILSILLLAQFQEGVCHAEGSLDIVTSLITEMAKLVIKYKDKFAAISGSLEGLVIAETLIEIEDWKNDDLLLNIVEDISSSVKYDYLTSKLRQILITAPIPLRHELGCMSKICGHPFVDMEGGAKKLHARTTKHKELSYESVSWVVNKAKESFVRNYITRHGKWPLCEITMQKPGKDPLLNAMLRNKDPYHPMIERKFGKIKNIDWARVELGQVSEFHKLENIIPFLKDKSVSVLRNVAVRKYIKHDEDSVTPWADTRLLLYYLFNPLKKIDHQAFLDRYTDCDDLNALADYLIIRLVPKEKEHKIAFRGFGVKTYLDRMRNLAQEKNTATFLDLYCDEQAMTMGELEISKRLYATRTILKAYKGHHVLNINFDSSGWNNCFRDETVKPVIRETVSKIMGHECLHRIHEGYENTLFVIPDGDITYHWDGQQGGIDGLNQYPWVWVYINQLKYALKDFPITSHIFCKGDDMRIAVIIKPELLLVHDMKTWHQMIVESVSETAKSFGHEIKVQESYGSEKYFTFSKASSLGPIELPQGFRKIQKVYGANNAMISTLDEFIASTFSNAHSACRTMTNTYSAYFVALVWAYYYIANDSRYSDLSESHLIALLLIPNMLGGFPIIYLHNMSVRAESDLLSPFLDMVIYAKESYPGLYTHLKKFLKVTKKSKIDIRKILKDPYSLWIETPTLPTAVLRSFILESLVRQVKNEDVKNLIKATKSSLSHDLIRALESASPFDAKILSTIYAATPEGVLSELLKKFETGRSILELIILKQGIHSADRKLRRVISTDYKLQQWRHDKLKSCSAKRGRYLIDPDQMTCPTQAAQQMRDLTWNKHIVGVSMPPLAHQMSLITPTLGLSSAHAKRNHFYYERHIPQIRINDELSDHWTSGDQKPFLGFRTRTGNIAPTVSFQDKDPLIIKVKNLLDLLSWVSRSKVGPTGHIVQSNLPDLIALIISMYTSLTADDLAPFSATRKSGTVQHHARAPRFKESIVPNVLSNAYQNVKGTSDTHITLRTSDQHYTVNFLHIMCSSIHLSQIELEVTEHVTTSKIFWAVTTDCKYCTEPIEEEPVIITFIPCIPAGSMVLNACRIDEISRNMILTSYQDFNTTTFKVSDQDSDPSDNLAKIAVAQEFVHHYFNTHTRLQNRFTHHTLTPDGHDTLVNLSSSTTTRIIGYTEMKKIRPADYCIALSTIIHMYITNQFAMMDQHSVLLSIYETPSTELPWHGLMSLIHNAGQLSSLIRYIHKTSGIIPTACQENPTASAPYVGYAIWVMIKDGKLPLYHTILTYKPKEQIVDELTTFSEIVRWKLINECFIKLTQEWKPSCVDETLKLDITRLGLYICALEINSEDILDMLKTSQTNEFIKVDYGTLNDLDINSIQETISNEDYDNHKVYSWMKQTYPSWMWDEVEEEANEGDIQNHIYDGVRLPLKKLTVNIGISDLASCILTVRNSRGDEDALNVSSSSSDGGYEDRPDEILVQGKSGDRKSSVLELPSISEFQTSLIGNYVDLDFTNSKIILDKGHSFRLFGSSTTSQSKLDHIFSVLRISKILPESLTITCLADGLGGFVEYLSTCTVNSEFHFNTLPSRMGANCRPHSAEWTLEENNNLCFTEALDDGYFDLTSEDTIQELFKHTPLNHVITNDADIKWDDIVSTEIIWGNTVRLFLTTGSHNSLLIMKINIALVELVTQMVTTLMSRCLQVYIVRCVQSNAGGECYLVAFGVVLTPIKPLTVRWVTSDHVAIIVDKFAEGLLNNFIRITVTQPPIPLWISLKRENRGKMNDLSCAVTPKLMSRMNIDFDVKASCVKSKSKKEVLKNVIIEVKKSQSNALKSALGCNEYFNRIQSFNSDTKTHKMHMSMTYLTCCGFLTACNAASRTNTLSKQFIRRSYSQSLDNLPDRFGFTIATKEHYSRNFKVNNNGFLSPYMRFIDGVRVAQMLIGYISQIPKPKE